MRLLSDIRSLHLQESCIVPFLIQTYLKYLKNLYFTEISKDLCQFRLDHQLNPNTYTDSNKKRRPSHLSIQSRK